MNFNTLEFVIFLPAVAALHWLLPHRARWAALLAASLFFYFWWEPAAGLLLLAVIGVTWLCGLGAADGLAPLVGAVYGAPGEASGPGIVLATALFGLQIYCDFSGYSDIARGSAALLGVELMENFRAPYSAASIRDFWRRWHISLTAWFTDYVYIPLGGSRRGLPRQCLNIMIVFLLSGLWHGADWTFVIWGGIHGLYQVCGVLARRREGLRLPDGPASGLLRRGRTLALVTFAWLFFRADGVGDAWLLLSRLGTGWGLPALGELLPLLRVLPALVCLPLLGRLPERRGPAGTLALSALVLAIGLGWWAGLSGGGENAFIYFRF